MSVHISSIVKLEHVSKTYLSPEKKALCDVSFEIPQGAFFALLGANGAGKSSLIHILAGLSSPSAGSVSIGPYAMEQEAAKARALVGFMPQEFNFSIFESLENILYYQAGFYGLEGAEVEQKAQWLLKKLHLWEKRSHPVNSLSGGMKRRLMIARALIHSPKLLLLDEPTTGIDIELRYQTWDFLKELNEDHGTSIILTTHYLEEAEALCDNMAFLKQGTIVAQGKMTELLNHQQPRKIIIEIKKSNPLVESLKLKGISYSIQSKTSDVEEVTINLKSEHHHQDLGGILAIASEHGAFIHKIATQSAQLEDYFFDKTLYT